MSCAVGTQPPSFIVQDSALRQTWAVFNNHPTFLTPNPRRIILWLLTTDGNVKSREKRCLQDAGPAERTFRFSD